MVQLLNYTNIRMTEEMRELAMENAKMTATMADLMKQSAGATEQMKISTGQNADATRRMADLAELNRQQAMQGERQAKSMAYLAYDAKRDSEVMKAITFVTLVFLPATFVSVSSNAGLEFTTYPLFQFADDLQHGFLQY